LARADDREGEVEFVAAFTQQGVRRKHHERSSSRAQGGAWYFVSGKEVRPKPVVRAAPKIGRNDPCPCGAAGSTRSAAERPDVDFYEAVRSRRSCRRYTAEEVSREALERIVARGDLRPLRQEPPRTGGSSWSAAMARDRLAEISGRSFGFQETSLRALYEEKVVEFTRGFFRDFGGAPVVLVFCTEKTADGPFVDLQAGAAAGRERAAGLRGEGLQGCWMTGPVRFAARSPSCSAPRDSTWLRWSRSGTRRRTRADAAAPRRPRHLARLLAASISRARLRQSQAGRLRASVVTRPRASHVSWSAAP